MKGFYENAYRLHLTRRMPVIIRVDGKAFHTFTRNFRRPYDMVFKKTMWDTAKYLCANVQNARLAYVQSDEISLLLIDYNKLTSAAWFDANLQKMCSVSASMATMAFTRFFQERVLEYLNSADYDKEQFCVYKQNFCSAMFDSRVFNIPESEICNYFVWRQQDATRNSIEAFGRSYFSDKALFKLNCAQIQDKVMTEFGANWNDCPTFFKRGVCVERRPDENREKRFSYVLDLEIPVFTQDRGYIEKHLETEDK